MKRREEKGKEEKKKEEGRIKKEGKAKGMELCMEY